MVLDPFFGTGTTGAVARRLGRHFVGIERDSVYVKAARERIAAIAPGDPLALKPRLNRRAASRVPFGTLVESGLLLPGQALFFDRRADLRATILADGSLQLNDGRSGSIHAIGALISGFPSCNGWDHWFYQESDALQPIDRLRERVRGIEIGDYP